MSKNATNGRRRVILFGSKLVAAKTEHLLDQFTILSIFYASFDEKREFPDG